MANEKMKNRANKSKNKTVLNEEEKPTKVKDFMKFYSDESGSSEGVVGKNKKHKNAVRKSSDPNIITSADISSDLATSTPIKSIIKIKPQVVVDDYGIVDFSQFKNKKRIKSVSFNLDDENTGGNKKKKSDEPEETPPNNHKSSKKDESNVSDAIKLAKLNKKKMKAEKHAENETKPNSKKQKRKVSPHESEVNKENELVKQVSKDGTVTNKKSRKQNESIEIEDKPDIITENLECLNIGDNPHSITSLLDEMTVANKTKDKTKSKKNKNKQGKNKNQNVPETIAGDGEENETPKWNKRKWNKDKKGDIDSETNHAVVVSNLPLNMLMTFRKVLAEHFSSVGTVKKIGVAEFYPAQNPTPVFTTTVYFTNEDMIQKALSIDCTKLCRNKLSVSRLLPVKETTAVLRTFGALTHSAICTTLSHLGPIRNIRLLTKGKNTIATAFVEFDGPESVNRVIAEANNTKIGGKKMHIAKYAPRKSIKCALSDAESSKSNAESTKSYASSAKKDARSAKKDAPSAKKDDVEMSEDESDAESDSEND